MALHRRRGLLAGLGGGLEHERLHRLPQVDGTRRPRREWDCQREESNVPDRNAVGEVYAACFQRLVVQLYAVTGDLSEAQEAVQEAFVRAVADPRQFGRLDNPEAWLCRVAINVSR